MVECFGHRNTLKQSSGEREESEQERRNVLERLPTVCLYVCQHQSLESKPLTFPPLAFSSVIFIEYKISFSLKCAFFFHELIN